MPSSWEKLVDEINHTFPNASTVYSSILPARGKHHMNKAIATSNENLSMICSARKSHFMDNSNHFLNKHNGLTNVSLYNDLIHPNAKGTIKLAQNMKRIFYEHWTKGQQMKSFGDFLLNRPGAHSGPMSEKGLNNYGPVKESFYDNFPTISRKPQPLSQQQIPQEETNKQQQNKSSRLYGAIHCYMILLYDLKTPIYIHCIA